jgi:hypothetical protein
MAAPVRYQRIVLRTESPWNYLGATTHVWSNKFNLSGDVALAANEMEPTALALWNPIKRLISADSSLVGWTYYPQGSHVKTGEATYPAGQHRGDASAYTDPTNVQNRSQLEVAVLVEGAVGKNSRGKQVYLRKWIHDVKFLAGDPNTIDAFGMAPSAILAEWLTGAGPKSLVPCDPTDGMIPPTWVMEQHLFTHQLRRGVKRKKTAATNVYVPVPVPIP